MKKRSGTSEARKPSETLRGRRVGVIGAGRSGIAAAKLLRRRGAEVLLSESGPSIKKRLVGDFDVEIGGHSERLLASDVLVRSPGVPNNLPILKKARSRGIPIWSELELAVREIHPRRLIAITGTNGKTTTTTLVGQLFRAAFTAPTFVGGNIGTPLSDLSAKISSNATVVLEVSSYQLEDIHRFHPNLSAVLNVTPDHLEHHGTLASYIRAKSRIFENQTQRDVCVLNADDAICVRMAKRCPANVLFFSRKKKLSEGLFYDKGSLNLHWRRRIETWKLDWRLPGMHNVENALAAIALAVAGGIPVRTIQTVLRRFKGVEHRLEYVRELAGVRYIDDSKATNVDSTRVALESFPGPLIVIMGGRGKGSPYKSLSGLLPGRVKRLLLIGEDASKIQSELGTIVSSECTETMAKAVERARAISAAGDTVLLSPACASFDQYKNYEERGRHFKTLVRLLR